jgi:hypothetical protein
VLSIVRDGVAGERHGSVAAETVRVEENAGRCVELPQGVEDILVLEAVVLLEEVEAPFAEGRRVPLVVPERRQPLPGFGLPGWTRASSPSAGSAAIQARGGGVGILERTVKVGNFVPW